MKKLIITLLFLMPFMTGCSSIEANLDFIDAKNVFFSADLKSDKQISEQELRLIKENYKGYLDEDYVTDVFLSGNSAKIEAVKLSKNIRRNDIDLSSLGFTTNNKSKRFIDIKKNIFVTLYNVDLTYDLSSQVNKINRANKRIYDETQKEANALNPEYLQKYGDEEISLDNPEENTDEDFYSNFDDSSISRRELSSSDKDNENISEIKENLNPKDLDIQFSVTLPSKASFNNADAVDDNTYYWNIKTGEPIKIKLQYITYNSWAIFVLLILILSILYALAQKILKHDAQKRIGTNN